MPEISVDFNTLPPYQPRQFVPDNADFSQQDIITALYEQLADRSVQSHDQMQHWLLDRSELEAAIDQHGTILYIRMTCQTDDAARAKAYKDFIETIVPAIKPCSDRLDRKFILDAKEIQWDPERYKVYIQGIRTDIELYREQNIPLQTEDSLLRQQYQTITGAMTVQFKGKEYPIPQIYKFLYETDRCIREQTWKAESRRRLEDKSTLDQVFEKMILLRHNIAENAGFENYHDYKFKEYHRFSYTPQDCKQFHTAVETHFVPLQRKLHQYRKEQMHIDRLRPWDLVADPLGKEPLKPADNIDDFTQGLQRMFRCVDNEFGDQFQMMRQNGLLDLESRKGKAPGGYQATLNEARKPFIFGNTIGINSDLRLMTHEGGHAFHALACAHDPLLAYRHGPIEFCEVASMSMELLSAAHLDIFYDASQQKRWWQGHLEGIVQILTSVARNDAFQHWIYENPGHTTPQREEKWIELSGRFGSGLIDWTDLQTEQASYWQRILHFYEVPFYYIEYGIAQLGALGIWLQSEQNMSRAISNYKNAMSLGGSLPLPELFETAGLTFDFSEKTVRPLSEMLLQEWNEYSV
jgi:oligoendopeptidase F